MSTLSDPVAAIPEAAETDAKSKPRGRGKRPSHADVSRIAAGLTATTKKAASDSLRESGMSASPKTVADVLEKAAAFEKRRRLRHCQNAEQRLGHKPRHYFVATALPTVGAPPDLGQRLHALRVRDVRRTAQDAFRHGASGGGTFNVRFARQADEVNYVVHIGQNWTTYRGSFKGWSAREDHHHIQVPSDWRLRVQARGLAILGGMMTLDAHPLTSAGVVEVFAATWARQGRGYDVQVDRGYIARLGDEHFHAETADKAITGLRRKTQAGATSGAYQLSVDAFASRYEGVVATVTLQDARESGSCEFGIRSWCAAVGLDYLAGGAALKAVLAGFRMRPQVEVRRAVLHALKRLRRDSAVEE
jgi:hypothetical protein